MLPLCCDSRRDDVSKPLRAAPAKPLHGTHGYLAIARVIVVVVKVEVVATTAVYAVARSRGIREGAMHLAQRSFRGCKAAIGTTLASHRLQIRARTRRLRPRRLRHLRGGIASFARLVCTPASLSEACGMLRSHPRACSSPIIRLELSKACG